MAVGVVVVTVIVAQTIYELQRVCLFACPLGSIEELPPQRVLPITLVGPWLFKVTVDGDAGRPGGRLTSRRAGAAAEPNAAVAAAAAASRRRRTAPPTRGMDVGRWRVQNRHGLRKHIRQSCRDLDGGGRHAYFIAGARVCERRPVRMRGITLERAHGCNRCSPAKRDHRRCVCGPVHVAAKDVACLTDASSHKQRDNHATAEAGSLSVKDSTTTALFARQPHFFV